MQIFGSPVESQCPPVSVVVLRGKNHPETQRAGGCTSWIKSAGEAERIANRERRYEVRKISFALIFFRVTFNHAFVIAFCSPPGQARYWVESAVSTRPRSLKNRRGQPELVCKSTTIFLERRELSQPDDFAAPQLSQQHIKLWRLRPPGVFNLSSLTHSGMNVPFVAFSGQPADRRRRGFQLSQDLGRDNRSRVANAHPATDWRNRCFDRRYLLRGVQRRRSDCDHQ